MARKTAFVNEMILKTLNQQQKIFTPAVQKAAILDDEVGEIFEHKTSEIRRGTGEHRQRHRVHRV